MVGEMDEKQTAERSLTAVALADGKQLDRYFVGLGLKRAQHELRLAINAELEVLGTNISHVNVLREIGQHPGVSSADLARVAFLTPQTLGQQVIQMQERGLVERRPGDGRKIRHYLTASGEKLLTAAMEKVREVDTQVLSDFDDDELAALLETFQTIECRAAAVRAHARRFAPVVVEP
jgi:DNA-binding MarR family transcriptional regulator